MFCKPPTSWCSARRSLAVSFRRKLLVLQGIVAPTAFGSPSSSVRNRFAKIPKSSSWRHLRNLGQQESCECVTTFATQTRSGRRKKYGMNLLNFRGIKWSGRVDLNHRPPGPEPAGKKSLSHRPGVTYGTWSNQKSPSDSQPFATGSSPDVLRRNFIGCN